MNLLNFHRVSLGLTAIVLLGLTAPQSAKAASLINFETLPDGTTPSKGLAISNQFEQSHGVTFSLGDGSSPILAKVGEGKPLAFESRYGNGRNRPAPGQDIGQFLLTDNFDISGRPQPLLITYSSPVSGASGELLDIDQSSIGNERWLIEALDNFGNPLDSIELQSGPRIDETGDGIATFWSFSRESEDIFSIRMSFTGSKTTGIGLGFDNFSPAGEPPISPEPVPEPSSLLGLFVFGAFGASSLLKRKQQQNNDSNG